DSTPGGLAGKPAEIAPLSPRRDPALTLRTCGVMPAEGAMDGVRVDGVERSFRGRGRHGGDVVALRGMSLRAAPGEIVAVVGTSGCGKSTLLELICGLQAPDAGTVRADPAVLMPQRDLLLPWASALDNAVLALRVRGVPSGKARIEALPWFERFGLSGFEAA